MNKILNALTPVEVFKELNDIISELNTVKSTYATKDDMSQNLQSDRANTEDIDQILSDSGTTFRDKTVTVPTLSYFYNKINGKYQYKEEGKGLSSNDYTTEEKEKLAGIESGANHYVLPTASTTTTGGVRIGSNISNDNGTISITGQDVTNALGYTPEQTGNILRYTLSKDGTRIVLTDSKGRIQSIQETTYIGATQSTDGLMTAKDKQKLDTIEMGAQVNNIERIQLNGVDQKIQFATVNLDLSDYVRKEDMTNVYIFKGSVKNYSDLPPAENVKSGYVYNIINGDEEHNLDPGTNVAWNAEDGTWDNLGGFVSLEGYATKEEVQTASNTSKKYTEDSIAAHNTDTTAHPSLVSDISTIKKNYATITYVDSHSSKQIQVTDNGEAPTSMPDRGVWIELMDNSTISPSSVPDGDTRSY